MRGHLQVRQLQLNASFGDPIPDQETALTLLQADQVQSMGHWHDVQSPGWLVGFCLPHPGLAYQFRYAPVDPL